MQTLGGLGGPVNRCALNYTVPVLSFRLWRHHLHGPPCFPQNLEYNPWRLPEQSDPVLEVSRVVLEGTPDF